MMKLFPFSILGLCLFFLFAACEPEAPATEQPPAAAGHNDPSEEDDLAGIHKTRGLIQKTDQATPGYVYFSPLFSDLTYLINLDGEVVHTWKSDFSPSGGLYLLDNGNLLRGAREPVVPRFGAGGQSGRLQEFTWDGALVWDFVLANDTCLLHHDVAILPNGNILAIAYEYISPERAHSLGRKPELIPKAGLWTDMILELEPVRPNGAKVVWEWHMIDHTVQDADPALDNYGLIAEHPERVDINSGGPLPTPTLEDLEKRRANKQLPPNVNLDNQGSDLMHSNAIAYHPELDQIAISIHHFNEIWILDHSTSREQAAGHAGGRSGKGGDILYRWGNPQMYDRGEKEGQQLFGQHDVRWIPKGMPGAGHLLVFNNRRKHGEGNYSSVYELEPPLGPDGRYQLGENGSYGPESPVWSFTAADTLSFFAPFISGAHRMKNGNTLVTSGPQGRFFEVNPAGEMLWEYWSPYSGDVRLPGGMTPQPIGPFIYAAFRATHISNDHPALQGRSLKPIQPQPLPHQ